MPYRWEPNAGVSGRYRDTSTGRFVASSTVRRELDQVSRYRRPRKGAGRGVARAAGVIGRLGSGNAARREKYPSKRYRPRAGRVGQHDTGRLRPRRANHQGAIRLLERFCGRHRQWQAAARRDAGHQGKAVFTGRADNSTTSSKAANMSGKVTHQMSVARLVIRAVNAWI
jgi:hypothetical protein